VRAHAPSDIPGLLVLDVDAHTDERGRLVESWSAERYAALGIGPFVQDNLTRSHRHVLRGLHLQTPTTQGKLIQVVYGRVFDVAVDVRRGSPAFGRWHALELVDDKPQQLWIPPGCAHGFYVLSDHADVLYKLTSAYAAGEQRTIKWNDPAIGIPWPLVGPPILSGRDADAAPLRDVDAAELPRFEPQSK
jgi:dTDP-4-dehydrorhamnose 3,5-epimerase